MSVSFLVWHVRLQFCWFGVESAIVDGEGGLGKGVLGGNENPLPRAVGVFTHQPVGEAVHVRAVVQD